MLGQNPQAAVTAAANEYMNNCAANDDTCLQIAKKGQLDQQSVLNPFSGPAFAAACGDGSQPCNAQILQTMLQAQAANADQVSLGVRFPDAVQFQGGGMMAAGSMAFDTQNGNSFAGPMINVNVPNPISTGAAINFIWLNQTNPQPFQVDSYLNGLSYSGGLIVRPPEGLPVSIGGGEGWSPGNGTATILSIGTPGASYSPGGVAYPWTRPAQNTAPLPAGPM